MELSAGIKPHRVGDKKSAYVVCMRSSPFSTVNRRPKLTPDRRRKLTPCLVVVSAGRFAV